MAVHVNVVPETLEVRITLLLVPPEQTDWLIGELVTIGPGLIKMTCVEGFPSQPPDDGVMI